LDIRVTNTTIGAATIAALTIFTIAAAIGVVYRLDAIAFALGV
jgi:hypothetical protein